MKRSTGSTRPLRAAVVRLPNGKLRLYQDTSAAWVVMAVIGDGRNATDYRVEYICDSEMFKITIGGAVSLAPSFGQALEAAAGKKAKLLGFSKDYRDNGEVGGVSVRPRKFYGQRNDCELAA